MKSHLKRTRIGKKIQSYFRRKEKEYEQDFDITFLKMEGKTWDQHMTEVCKKQGG